MPTHDIVVIGTSAGGVQSLTELVRLLPPGLPASLFVVMHFPPYGTSRLPKILMRASSLPATHAQHGEAFQPGHIYIAPPDQHLLVRAGHLELSHGPRENRARPSIDVLFRSAAQAYGKRVVAVVLSGTLSDGSSGLLEVGERGGLSVVQDPEEALFPSMPQSAILKDHVRYVLPVAEIAPLLGRLAQEAVAEEGAAPMRDNKQKEQETIDRDMAAQARDARPH